MDAWLKEIIESDDLGILKVKPKSSAPTADEHLLNKFRQINDFYSKNNREPSANKGNPIELMRNKSLEAIRANKQHCKALEQYDVYNLLPKHSEAEPDSINAIFADDVLGILNQPEDSIFTLKHVRKPAEMPDKIARRKRCEDYQKFEPLIAQCQKDLDSQSKVPILFSGEHDISEGDFFIFRGFITYVAQVGERKEKNGKLNARVRLIFSNGTEIDMLSRSFARELYRGQLGQRIVDANDRRVIEKSLVTSDDKQSGFIYILSSLSEVPEIKSINNLYKIGYSTTTVEKRIANAANEATYLMAPVNIVAEFECFNMKTNKLEGLLHTFFGHSCLDVKVADNHGVIHTPREWFIAPLTVIREAIEMIMSGDIIHYRYDELSQQIVEK